MARYKNIRRTASVRQAVRFWWNVVKNYDEYVYDQDFFDIVAYNLKRDEVAAIIGGNFSGKELQPLKDAKENKLELDSDNVCFMLRRIWNEKTLRKGCRAVLKIMRDRILRKLVPSEEDVRFERRFAALCVFLGLDKVESDLFMLMYVRSATVFDDFPEDEEIGDRPQYYAMAIDRSYPEVLSALSRKGRLARYNCMTSEYWFNQPEFGGYFEGTDGAPLDERYYRANSEEALPWGFFGRLSADDGAILKEMLRARKGGGRLNILLYGVPGAGKTSFARSLAAEAGLQAYDLLQGESDGKNISAETRLAGIQIFNARMASGGNLLVVDEADELLRTAGTVFGERSRGGSEKGVINTILDGMKAPAIWISNAAADDMDESVRRRFDYSVHFRSLSLVQREKIWRNNIRRLDMDALIPESSAAALAERYETSAGGITMVLENVKRLNPDSDHAAELVERIMRPHCELMHSAIQDGKGKPASDYSLDGLNVKGDVGLDRILEAVRNFQKERADRSRPRQADLPRMNLLLWGPPGTGKTEYVKYLGSQLKSKVVVKMGSDLLDKYVGGTEERIAAAFAEAEAEKAILFLDEIDGLLQNRAHADHSWEVTQVDELLHQMENFGGVMVGATNFFENLDPAVLRRFTFKIEFGYLDDAGKRTFFERTFKTSLSAAEASRLDAVANLAPGDFRTVRQSLYYLGSGVDNAMRIGELEREAGVKSGGRRAKVGF
ncbi:MAG: AAA family ATPase [Kiritimatiellae bacterium]|nr:AAA family ATPase [Kiritimatiellia bacterium]